MKAISLLWRFSQVSLLGVAIVHSLIVSDSLWPHGPQHARLPWPSPSPGVCSISCPLSWWCYPTHLILCHFLLLLPSIFPSIRVFSNESALPTRWPKYWSFSISPSDEYSGLICFRIDWVWSPCSPGDSQGFSPTLQLESINSLVLRLLYGPTFTSIHDYWKNHSFDETGLCWESNVSPF